MHLLLKLVAEEERVEAGDEVAYYQVSNHATYDGAEVCEGTHLLVASLGQLFGE